MDKWFGIDTEGQPMLGLKPAEKKHKLYLDQKATLELFLERGAISKNQYEKTNGDDASGSADIVGG